MENQEVLKIKKTHLEKYIFDKIKMVTENKDKSEKKVMKKSKS